MRTWLLWMLGVSLPAAAAAYIDIEKMDLPRPSVPPALERPLVPASVVHGGDIRTTLHFDYLSTVNSGRQPLYPYGKDGQALGGGLVSRTGWQPGGMEFDLGLDYPFCIPSTAIRYQMIGYGGNWGPKATLEFGMNFMPDYHAGAALGAGLGEKVELWSAYRGGRVLDRGYSEVSGGLTLHAADEADLGAGLSWRRYDTEGNEEALRASLVLDFGNPTKALEGAEDGPHRVSASKLLAQKRYKAAARAFEDEIEFSPREATLWKGYSQALEGMGMDEEARKARLKALSLEGDKNAQDEGAELERKLDLPLPDGSK